MNPFKTRKFKISRRKSIFKLLPRQHRRILNLLRQNNQKDHNILDNPLIDATNYHYVSAVPVSHCSFDQMSYVNEQYSELSSIDSINVNNFLYPERNILFVNESDQNSNKEVNIFHVFQKISCSMFCTRKSYTYAREYNFKNIAITIMSLISSERFASIIKHSA